MKYCSSSSWVLVAAVYMGLLQGYFAAQRLSPAAKADRIEALPGQAPNVSFQQFAGYITVDNRRTRSFFYYFVEAEYSPDKKPLVLWLNGGPGCSSLGAGAFMEHGPFKPDGKGLIRNPHSWNKVANMLYVESPAGVGFSFSTIQSYYSHVNDAMTVQDNLKFLEGWLLKFPEYNDRDLFITGESYAGHYVPQLAQLIVKQSPKIKQHLKAIALGNPLLEFETDFNAVADFWWSHALVSDSTYQRLILICNYSRYMHERNRGQISKSCLDVFKTTNNEIGSHIDPYDVILDVCLSGGELQSQVLLNHLAWPRSRIPHFLHLSQLMPQKQESSGSGGLDLCIGSKIVEYLNRNDVQKAFHARLIGVQNWSFCSDILVYDLKNLEIPIIGIVGELLRAGIRTMVYSGDQDAVLPFIGTRLVMAKIAASAGLNTTVSYRNWFQGNQVGGWTQVYGNRLTFATIRGASHTTPYTQPERSLSLFSAFLSGKPLPESGP